MENCEVSILELGMYIKQKKHTMKIYMLGPILKIRPILRHIFATCQKKVLSDYNWTNKYKLKLSQTWT
jgi:hypothetical protein